MPDTLYKNFYDPTKKYKRESRAFCYEMCTSMIKQSKRDVTKSWYTNIKTIQAILLLEYCWNFAAKKTKKLSVKSVQKVIFKNEKLLKQLEQYSFLTLPKNLEGIIKKIVASFSHLFDQTGATKALSLLNPELFVMWDTKIRKRLRKELMYKIDNGQTSDQYLLFLHKLQDYSSQYNFKKRLSPNAILAKKIDEYHYVEIVLPSKKG
jgi:hypothetical protein